MRATAAFCLLIVGLPACVAFAHRAGARAHQVLTHHRSAPPFALATAGGAERLGEARTVRAWVERSEGSCKGADVAAEQARGLGLVATDAARRGDTLVSVPLSLGLSAEGVLRSSIGVYLTEFDPELADYAFIALALLHERRLGEQSELAPWLSSTALLPADGFDDLPLLWDDESFDELGEATSAGAAARREAVRADHAWLVENVFEQSPVFFPEIGRAHV